MASLRVFAVAAAALVRTGSCTESLCSSGISRHGVCCATSCGECSPVLCGRRPGGPSRCCPGTILVENKKCASPTETGCLLPEASCLTFDCPRGFYNNRNYMYAFDVSVEECCVKDDPVLFPVEAFSESGCPDSSRTLELTVIPQSQQALARCYTFDNSSYFSMEMLTEPALSWYNSRGQCLDEDSFMTQVNVCGRCNRVGSTAIYYKVTCPSRRPATCSDRSGYGTDAPPTKLTCTEKVGDGSDLVEGYETKRCPTSCDNETKKCPTSCDIGMECCKQPGQATCSDMTGFGDDFWNELQCNNHMDGWVRNPSQANTLCDTSPCSGQDMIKCCMPKPPNKPTCSDLTGYGQVSISSEFCALIGEGWVVNQAKLDEECASIPCSVEDKTLCCAATTTTPMTGHLANLAGQAVVSTAAAAVAAAMAALS